VIRSITIEPREIKYWMHSVARDLVSVQ